MISTLALHTVDYVSWMLDNDGDVPAAIDAGGMNQLHVACASGHLDMVQLLCQRCTIADMDVHDWKRRTPFHLACAGGHLEIAKVLVAAGCKVNPKISMKINAPKNTALLLAVDGGHLEVVKWLFTIKCNKAQVDENGRTLLHRAVMTGNLAMIAVVLKKCSAGCFADREKQKQNVLQLAIELQNLDVFKLLMKHCRGAEDENVLGPALDNEATEILEWLFAQKLNVDAGTPSALVSLAMDLDGHTCDKMRVLLDHGADPNQRFTGRRPGRRRGWGEHDETKSCLQWCGHANQVVLLLKAGARWEPNVATRYNSEAKRLLAQKHLPAVLQVLLSARIARIGSGSALQRCPGVMYRVLGTFLECLVP
jgi:ankyrin repeat protein